MLVLVTGATGFLGRRVVPELQSLGHEVRCLVHTPGRERIFPTRSVDIHYGSVLDVDALAAAFYGAEAVVSLVGIIRRGKGATYDAINRQGVANLVAAAKQVRTKHFIQVSAIGASSDRAYPYLYSKWQGEQEVVSSGLPYTIVRPSIMFGEGDEFLTTLAGLVRVFPLAPVAGSGRNRLQPISADDLARCIALAVDREDLKGRAIEIGGPQQLSYNEIVAVVGRALGKRRPRLHLPISLMYLATALLQTLRPHPPATTDQLRMLGIRNVSEVGVVEKTFGFTPRTLEGNIDFVRSVTFGDGLSIALGSMPAHLRDH
ncbi:MAG: NAD(P)H-binding protein [Chloroflexota bacterium]